MTNLLSALTNIQRYKNNDLKKITAVTDPDQPRINKEGTPFDAYVKDAFCNSFGIRDPNEKMSTYKRILSHLGSQNHPPDLMIIGGDAIEVKKVKGKGGNSIALNSSYPKSKLYANSPMLTEECKNCEKWTEKDIAYCVGHVFENKVKLIIFVYGDCYAASPDVYEAVMRPVVKGIKSMKIKLAKTKELARLNNVDPLAITDLRVRGMWQIVSPRILFADFIKPDLKKNCSVYAIMQKKKFESFPSTDKQQVQKNMQVSDIQIKSPDAPKKLLDCKLISFSF